VNSREFQDQLLRRAVLAGVSVPSRLGNKLETYYRLLAAWSRKMNLTGMHLAEPAPEVVDRLLIEPLAAAKHAAADIKRMVDIGSGGGSPAIPFALALPGLSLLMVESRARKSVFLREAIRALDMEDADVAQSRFESLLSRLELHEAHDLLTIRAVRVEPRVLMRLQAFVRPGGQLFLFRSSISDAAEPISPPLSWVATHPLVHALQSSLVVVRKVPQAASQA
jgi:16S rRNA (guanine527-N7)-methyltransferase